VHRKAASQHLLGDMASHAQSTNKCADQLYSSEQGNSFEQARGMIDLQDERYIFIKRPPSSNAA